MTSKSPNSKNKSISVLHKPIRIYSTTSPNKTMKSFHRNKIFNLHNSPNTARLIANSKFNNGNKDLETLQEELLQMRKEVLKKSKELSALRISYGKLEEEHKQNLNFLEELISSIKSNNEENDIVTNLKNLPLEQQTLVKLNYKMNLVRKVNHDMKISILRKDEELSQLKQKDKITKLIQSELDKSKLSKEIEYMKDNLEILSKNLIDYDKKLRDMTNEKDYYKNSMIMLKKKLEDDNDKFSKVEVEYGQLLKLCQENEKTISRIKKERDLEKIRSVDLKKENIRLKNYVIQENANSEKKEDLKLSDRLRKSHFNNFNIKIKDRSHSKTKNKSPIKSINLLNDFSPNKTKNQSNTPRVVKESAPKSFIGSNKYFTQRDFEDLSLKLDMAKAEIIKQDKEIAEKTNLVSELQTQVKENEENIRFYKGNLFSYNN